MPNPVAHIVGARPNFMKAAPIVKNLKAIDSTPQLLVHTGQHYDPALSSIFFDQLEMPAPDRYLGVGSGSHAVQTAALMTALEGVFIDDEPTACVVYGDVNSTVAAALVASKLGIPVVHVEAGLRSFDRSMPEEINRLLTDAISDLLLVTSPEAYGNLGNEGIDIDKIRFVGNTMIDSLQAGLELISRQPPLLPFEVPKQFVLVTLHRPANVDDPERLAEILAALSVVSSDIDCLFPVHPRGREAIELAGGTTIKGLSLLEPQGYLEFLTLQRDAALVITDSGGVQEETTVLGTPCITVRPNTERPITVSMGTNQLAEPETLAAAAKEMLSSPPNGEVPPLWDGRAGGRAAAAIVDWLARSSG
ncbi:MAG: UDP-N-acetylglucosamine 2-epimerase (non-hydrolyzing) [Acidimicrobiia bacterium]